MLALLRSAWDEPRPARPPSRVWRDWVLVAALVPIAVLEGALRTDLSMRAVSVALAVGGVPVLLWRRTQPLLAVLAAFGITAVASLATGGEATQLHTMVYLLLLPYALVRWGTGREIVLGGAVVLASAVVSMLTAPTTPGEAIGGFAVLSAAVALGAALRYRVGARLREFDQVKLLERERLARDLHDTVAHHVSAIVIRAQAGLATAATRPEAAAEALRVIEVEAARTLAEMRSMVHVLRRNQERSQDLSQDGSQDWNQREPADLAPSPTIADLVELANRTNVGPVVEVEIIGDVADLAPPVAAAVYRLAQESVTNALRHARHVNRVEVSVAADDTSVRLRVRDDGDPSALRPPATRGYGLTGMIERAHLLGGTCEVGPSSDRGWTVTAVIPRTGWTT